MIDSVAAQLALRARATSVVIATTGSTSLSATTTGYARAAGSFLTDGFAPGMEVLVAGFATAANNGYGVITFVSATVMSVTKYALGTVSSADATPTIAAATATSAEVAAAGRSIVAGLPILRAYENTKIAPSPIGPYVEEDFVPATTRLLSSPALSGDIEETGIYFLKLYGLSGKGVSALRKSTDALTDLFTPGTTLTAGSHTVRVRTDIGPRVGALLPLDSGWTVATLSVPWLAYSTNAIAA